LCLSSFGRGERIRTSDPQHPMLVRYQAALRPVNNEVAIMFYSMRVVKEKFLISRALLLC
jgi:hypothetical protein